MKTIPQPTGEPAGLIRKYYPDLGQHLPSPALPELAGEWFSDLSRLGGESIGYYASKRHERASNKAEFLTCLATLLTEAEQHAHLSGYGYRRHYPPDYLTPEREGEIEASGRSALRAVREWHTLASLTPIERFLDRARKIELWQNERHQLTTRIETYDKWENEYGTAYLEFTRAVRGAKNKQLRAAYAELTQLLPTLDRPSWLLDRQKRCEDFGEPFFATMLTGAFPFCEFTPLRPTDATLSQRSECFLYDLHEHLVVKEFFVWTAIQILAPIIEKPLPDTPLSFQPRPQKPVELLPGYVPPSWTLTKFDIPSAPLDTSAAPTPEVPAAPLPWDKINALAESISLRKNGVFLLKPKWVAMAMAGMIDALCEAEILPQSGQLKRLHAEFSHYYGRKIGADRLGETRLTWQKKAREQLGLGY